MIILVLLFPLLLAFWLWWPVAGLGRQRRRWYAGLTFALGLLQPLLGWLWRRQAFGDVANAWVQLLFGWVMVAFALALVFVLLRDVLWLPLRLSRRAGRLRGFLHGTRLHHTVVPLLLLLATLGTYNGLKPPKLQERELVLSSLPAELDGLRVAVLADLHASPVKGAWRTQRIVDEVLAAKPDLIVLPGDMVDGQVAGNAANVAALAELHAPHGVWVAPGNHEYYSNYAAWMAHFRQMGLGVLENQAVLLDINGRKLAVSGVGDPTFYRNPEFVQGGGIAPDIAGVARQAQGSDFHLLLAHQPKLAREAAASGAVDLQVSGHTHGGHIIGMDRWLVAPFNDGYVRGEYRVGGMTLFVSAGVGQWDGFTARLGVPSSIDVLVLRRGAR
ncbi:MAG: metallophosphoesterase [Stenotrophomonas sp.]